MRENLIRNACKKPPPLNPSMYVLHLLLQAVEFLAINDPRVCLSMKPRMIKDVCFAPCWRRGKRKKMLIIHEQLIKAIADTHSVRSVLGFYFIEWRVFIRGLQLKRMRVTLLYDRTELINQFLTMYPKTSSGIFHFLSFDVNQSAKVYI
ncbi:hypothetical protein CDAR_263381 [Caerostris darwini]|uniref:Uncharacterized protein n=1 Tax=Caerostris darwini TaxID=1538125 RepID=A0AAV4S0S6_9ARAC|nr:hypothetical protein CDAR_263381 [Caerostris darwini]